jgi:hypothetical protein
MKKVNNARWMEFWESFETVWQNAPELASQTREIRIRRAEAAHDQLEVDWVL